MKLIRKLALVAVLIVPINAAARVAGKERSEAISRAALEQQLWKLDQQWLNAVQNRKMTFLDHVSTSQFIEVLPGGWVVTKADQMERLAKVRRKPGIVCIRDDFKLRGIYGNIALATGHVTQKGIGVYGRDTTGDYRAVRVFIRQGGRWMAAESALVPIGFHQSTTARHVASNKSEPGASHTGLEKRLWEVDQKWEEAARNGDLVFLRRLYTSQCFVVLPGGRVADRSKLLAVVAKAPRGPNIGAFPDEFRLRAVYGNFAIATDRTVFKGAVLPDAHSQGAYRIVKFFVKQNGEWRAAGAADMAIASN